MSRAEEQALKFYPVLFSERQRYGKTNIQKERRNAFENGYEQAKQDYIEYAQLWVDSGEVNIKSFKQFLKDRGYE